MELMKIIKTSYKDKQKEMDLLKYARPEGTSNLTFNYKTFEEYENNYVRDIGMGDYE